MKLGIKSYNIQNQINFFFNSKVSLNIFFLEKCETKKLVIR